MQVAYIYTYIYVNVKSSLQVLRHQVLAFYETKM